jgi:predicted anti-sigma-YlaC factor YlaD
MTTCSYSFDDGAYVLGALSPAERADFERHLGTCAECRESVAALAVLPGLLGRLDAATVAPHPITAPPTLLPRVLAMASTRRRAEKLRRRWLSLAAGIIAILLVTGAGVGMRLIDSPSPTNGMTAMRPLVADLPVVAEVGLKPTAEGTQVNMWCRYSTTSPGSWTLSLVMYLKAGGKPELLGTWTAGANQDWLLHSDVTADVVDIGRIEMQRPDGLTLFIWTPDTT